MNRIIDFISFAMPIPANRGRARTTFQQDSNEWRGWTASEEDGAVFLHHAATAVLMRVPLTMCVVRYKLVDPPSAKRKVKK